MEVLAVDAVIAHKFELARQEWSVQTLLTARALCLPIHQIFYAAFLLSKRKFFLSLTLSTFAFLQYQNIGFLHHLLKLGSSFRNVDNRFISWRPLSLCFVS